MGPGLLALPLWVILLLPFAKILTTGLSIGSGGSGGIFGPGMVIGGMVGAVVWRLCYHVLPGVPSTPAPFVIVGMMALFGGIARAPLAVMLMVAEMTGNLSLLAPAMIAVSISYVMVGQNSIYRSQVPTRADSPAHRLQFSFPLLSTLAVRQAMSPFQVRLSPSQAIAEALSLLGQADQKGAPVVDEQGILRGVLDLEDIEHLSLQEREGHTVGELMKRDVHTIHIDETLDNALEQLTSDRLHWAPVIDVERLSLEPIPVGMLSVADIVNLYRTASTKDMRRMQGMIDGTVMLETTVEPAMPLANCLLRDAKIPTDCLIVSIQREGEQLFPRGGTLIKPGDTLTVLMSPQGETYWDTYLRGNTDQNKKDTTLLEETTLEKAL